MTTSSPTWFVVTHGLHGEKRASSLAGVGPGEFQRPLVHRRARPGGAQIRFAGVPVTGERDRIPVTIKVKPEHWIVVPETEL